MEDRATLRISSQEIANWLHHGLVDEAQVRETFARMAVLVDEQNAGEPGYQPMSKDLEHSPSFQAALELVFAGRQEPNGYTERALTHWRQTAKAAGGGRRHPKGRARRRRPEPGGLTGGRSRRCSSLPFSGSTCLRYGGGDATPVDPVEFAPPRGHFVVGYAAREPAACGGWAGAGRGPSRGHGARTLCPARRTVHGRERPARRGRRDQAHVRGGGAPRPRSRPRGARRAGALRRRGRTAAHGARDRHAPARGRLRSTPARVRADRHVRGLPRFAELPLLREGSAGRRVTTDDQQWRDRRDRRRMRSLAATRRRVDTRARMVLGANRSETRRERARLRVGRVLLRSRTRASGWWPAAPSPPASTSCSPAGRCRRG